jgi:hypothetical protein
MKLVHDVQIDRNTTATVTVTIDRGWLRMDHVSAGTYFGGSSIRLSHVVRIDKQQQASDGETYFWITLTDRDAVKTVLPFALKGEEVNELDDAIVAS